MFLLPPHRRLHAVFCLGPRALTHWATLFRARICYSSYSLWTLEAKVEFVDRENELDLLGRHLARVQGRGCSYCTAGGE